MNPARRHLMRSAALAPTALAAAGLDAAAATPPHAALSNAAGTACAAAPRWGRGLEGQRRADLGDGRYLNPILAGDHPDPTVLRDGDDYYITFSSFDASPGLEIHHSRDLVNWTPIGHALPQPIAPQASVWACDLVKHQGRYFIYIPVMAPGGSGIWVIHAERITGPWSAPIDLRLPGAIDPGHVVGEDGRRYLFVNGIRRVRLSDDGLATDGPLEPACTPWRYPEDWVVEMFAPEGPKLFWREGWLYLVSAVGGTAGPATSHMVTLARARSVHGPWQDCPHNPIVRTRSAAEPWWSRGHATVVQGPGGDWWMVYHGYENGHRTLGRQTLLEPVRWTADGWLQARGGALDRPLPKPRGRGPAAQAGQPMAPQALGGAPLSDDFAGPRLGRQWAFAAPGADEARRLRFAPGGGLLLAGKGRTLADCSPLTALQGDRDFEAELDFTLPADAGPGCHAGLGLYYNERGHAAVAYGRDGQRTYGHGDEQTWMRVPAADGRPIGRVRIRLRCRDQVLRFDCATDDGPWQRHPWQMEVSGLHHNVFGGFLSLRLAVFAAGPGTVRLNRFRYRGLDGLDDIDGLEGQPRP